MTDQGPFSAMTLFRVHALFEGDLPKWRSTVADGAQRCIATRRLAEQLEHMPAPAFGTTLEAWFETLEEAREWAGRIEADYSPAALLTTREFPVFDVQRAGREIKGKFLFRRKEGMSGEAFRAYWLERHGPIVLRTPELLRYVQSHVIANEDDESHARYDGITEIYWLDYASAVRSMKSSQMSVEQAQDAPNFVAPRSVEVMLLSEEALA